MSDALALAGDVDEVLATGPPEDPTRYVVEPGDLEAAVTGGEGVLYRARHRETGEVVALKLLTAATTDDLPVVAERAAVLAGIRHPNLMEQRETFLGCPLGTGADGDPAEFDLPYSVAAWIDGHPLPEAAPGADLSRQLRWIADIAAALHHLHTVRDDRSPNGVVHRDVKPSNIRIRPDGSAVLVDFGLARPVHPDDMTQGAGTYLWRAPEVLDPAASVGAAADTWALGAVAHWILTGQPPALDGSDPARERLARSLQPVSATARSTAGHLARLLATSPTDRPRNLELWARELLRPPSPPRRSRRAAAVVVAAAALGLIAYLVTRTGASDATTAPRFAAAPSATTTAPTTTPPLAATIRCEGTAIGTLDSNPPLRVVPGLVTFTLRTPSTSLPCTDPTSAAVTWVRLEGLSVAFSNLGCFAIGAESNADGQLRLRWSNGRLSTARARVRLQSMAEGVLTAEMTSGAFAGGSAEVPFRYVAPPGQTQAFTGDCASGITSETIQVDGVTFTVPAE